MPPSPSILLFGHDDVLLYTRREILDRAGFQVRIALSLKELELIALGDHLDLIVICNSVSRQEGAKASRVTRDCNPITRSLMLEENLPAYGGILNANQYLIADTFLAAVQKAVQIPISQSAVPISISRADSR
jgi:CheY-like chemotaxis protein